MGWLKDMAAICLECPDKPREMVQMVQTCCSKLKKESRLNFHYCLSGEAVVGGR